MKFDHLDVFPALRGVVGKWVFYSTVMTADQIARRVSTAKSIRETKSLDDHLQRELKNNVSKICKYLLGNEWRMFNSIIVGVFEGVPDWITFDLDKIDRISDLGDDALNYLSDSMGLLHLTGSEKMFAIDGQHRVEAIKCALEEGGDTVTSDQYPIIMVAHNDSYDGKKRTRKLFADINKKAIKVSSGDLVIIDEEDINAIVARKLYAEYAHFAGGKLVSLTQSANLDRDDISHFINLLTLSNISKSIKPRSIKTNSWVSDDIDTLYTATSDFFDFVISNIDEYENVFIDKSKSIEYYRKDKINLLFRPIGIKMLARLYCFFKKSDDLQYLKDNINRLDFDLPGQHFDLVMWNQGRFETKYQATAYPLCLHLLNKLPEGTLDGPDGLRAKYDLATKGAKPLPGKAVD